jgi:hypothetical protein
MSNATNNNRRETMKREQVKAEQINVAGVRKVLWMIPVQIDDSWVWYENRKAYCKAATSAAEFEAIKTEVAAIIEN